MNVTVGKSNLLGAMNLPRKRLNREDMKEVRDLKYRGSAVALGDEIVEQGDKNDGTM